MGYRYWHGNRGRRGFLGFPFMLIFFLIFFSHSFEWFGFLIMIGIMIGAFYVLRGIMRTVFGASSNGAATTYHPSNQARPIYQPYQQSQPYETSYQPYEQGYQPTYQATAQYQPETQQEHYGEKIQPQYDEQPRAEYPQELPPIQQW